MKRAQEELAQVKGEEEHTPIAIVLHTHALDSINSLLILPWVLWRSIPIGDHYVPIWLHYISQLRQTHCFDIDVHPGSPLGAGVLVYNFNEDTELMMELANSAIQEYNERECNVFKYKVLKIEKVNFTVTDYFDYFMTVKVRNLTLVTPIETFQIHAGKRCRDGGGKAIYCCQPKGELRGEVCQGEKEKALEEYLIFLALCLCPSLKKLKIFCNYLVMVRSICGAAQPSTIPSLRSLAFLAQAGSAVLVSIGTSVPRMVANEAKKGELHFELHRLKNKLPAVVVKGITTVQRAVVNKEQQKDHKNDVKGETYELLVEGLLLISEHTILVSGVDLQFHWDKVEASERQPDGSLFSWFERYCCHRHIIYGIVNTSTSAVILKSDGNEVHWEPGKPLLRTLESMGIEKEVFPVHDETKRKQLLRSWALNWWELGLYWQLFGLASSFRISLPGVQLADECPAGVDNESKFLEGEWYQFQSPVELMKKQGADKTDKPRGKEAFQREEWLGRFMRFRNDAMFY
ncbi:hypothetical protein KY289_018275 [Solanum tuberosum]|nr:hypothetical protein KY289_018275 [Solanum tuberosum]